MNLDADQQRANALTGNLVVSAGPGSGKTGGVIIPKALKLLRERKRVGIVTFTRSAALEVKSRLAKFIPGTETKGLLFVGTFHAVIAAQLRNNGRNINILTPPEQKTLIESCLNAERVFEPDERELVIHGIDVAKRTVVLGSIDDAKTKLVYNRYQLALADAGKLDLNDLIVTAVRQMKEVDNPLPPMRLDLLLVDEFHDVDAPQLEWTIMHAVAGIPTCVVADDDQSIYAFRASLGYEAIVKFEEATKAAHVTLGINYRSHKEIVDVAYRVIKNNSQRIEKNFHSYNGPGGNVQIKSFDTRLVEMYSITEALSEVAQPIPDSLWRTIPKGEWMVICRNNYQLDDLALHLAGEKVKIANFDFTKLWKRRPLNILIGLLRAVAGDPSQFDKSLSGMGFTVETRLAVSKVAQSNIFGWMLTGQAKLPPDISRHTVDYKSLKTLISLVPRWVQMNEAGRPAMLNMLINAVHAYVLETLAGTHPDAAAGMASSLQIGVKILLEQRGTVNERIDAAMEGQRDKEATDGVALYTMHGSKGLEAENVWVMTVDSSMIPDPETDINEERRLFYVAITRAKKRLIISYGIKGNGEKRAREYSPSPFLAELGILEHLAA